MEQYAKLKDDYQATIRRAPAKARCADCGMKGHQYGDCYALQKALMNGKVTLKNLDKTGVTPSSPLPPQVVYTPYPTSPASPLTYPAAGYPAQTPNAKTPNIKRQSLRNCEDRPDRYPNRDPRNNRDLWINWRPEYRPNNYTYQSGCRNRDTCYRPNYNENNRHDRTNRYPRAKYQDCNEVRRYNDRNNDRRYEMVREITSTTMSRIGRMRPVIEGRLHL